MAETKWAISSEDVEQEIKSREEGIQEHKRAIRKLRQEIVKFRRISTYLGDR